MCTQGWQLDLEDLSGNVDVGQSIEQRGKTVMQGTEPVACKHHPRVGSHRHADARLMVSTPHSSLPVGVAQITIYPPVDDSEAGVKLLSSDLPTEGTDLMLNEDKEVWINYCPTETFLARTCPNRVVNGKLVMLIGLYLGRHECKRWRAARQLAAALGGIFQFCRRGEAAVHERGRPQPEECGRGRTLA